LLSAASVATTTRVVLVPSPDLSSTSRGNGVGTSLGERAPNSPACSNGQAQNTVLSGMVTAPSVLTAASAPTVMGSPSPRSSTKDALPRPPFKFPAVAPRPAPALPSANSRAAAAQARRPSSR
jgi:hypothetical protein